MPELNAFILLAIIVLMVLADAKLRIMPFLLLILATALFSLALNGSLPWTSKEFNTGFGQTISAAGLAILAGAMVARLAENSGANTYWRKRWKGRGLAVIAAIAGLGGTPLAALAVLTPVLRAAGTDRTRLGLTASYAVNAAQGCLVPSPLPIAALAILGGDWRWALGLGAVVALPQIVVGLALARRAPVDMAVETPSAPPSRRAAPGLVLAATLLIALVMAQSLGQIPSEPLGGGNTREDLLGLGRPMILLLVGLIVAAVTMGGFRRNSLSDDGWVGHGGREALGIFLAVGAAGGFQMVLHNNGMAALIAERVAALPPALGIAVPFLVALASRLVQGSPLTAAITAAGMMQPLLAPLGLDTEAGRGLAAVAIGAGAMAGPHLNDGYFWLSCHHAGLRAAQGLRWVTGGALAQGAVALGVLSGLAILIP
ncbi:MAG: GntP family permease [Rhodospirillaceae bacterium]|nr:GntP family permease [Rhodospirillales bacterium]